MFQRLIRVIRNPSLIVIKAMSTLLDPRTVLRNLWKRFPWGPFELRLDWDIFPKPFYAFGVYNAALMAKRLGHERMSVIEFGVGKGRGLIMLEALAEEVESLLGVKIEIYAYDTGAGLPPPVDYRDIPYLWEAGDFAMDASGLKTRLKRSQLILGDVKDTLGEFAKLDPAPVGFISFDLDYYSSTVAAFNIFSVPDSLLAPRVLCYFDDILGSNRHIGELLAIEEFNAANLDKKIEEIHGLQLTRKVRAVWNNKMMMMHHFKHPRYNDPIGDVPHFPG